MDRLTSDVVHALRRLARSPAYSVVALLTLALGIGATTGIFSLVRAVLLDPLPYRDADRLVMLWGARDRGEMTWLSGPELRDYQAAQATFSSVAAYTTSAGNLTGGIEPERVITAAVTTNLFATLGVGAAVGRAFAASDDPAAAAGQVVLAHALWQRRFGGRPDIVGATIQIDGSARTVIGVMPPAFRLPLDFAAERPSEVWTPLDHVTDFPEFGDHSLIGVARLTTGVTPAMATATMHTLEERWVRDGNWTNRDLSRRAALPVRDLVTGDVRAALWVLFGAVGAILLIACANVANLTLARSDDRHREIAVRAALGASRATVVRQLLTESLIVSAAGGALGLMIAWASVRALETLRPAGLPRLDGMGIDAVVLGFSMAVVVVTGLLFGAAPALELARTDLNRSLRDGGRGSTGSRGRQRFRDALAVGQLAFSVVLLVGALLLVRSFIELRRIDPGFRANGALTARVTLPVSSYPSDGDVIRLVRDLQARIAALPGVTSVGATRLLPLTGTIGDWSITLEGRERRPEENPNGDFQVVTPGYFETMGMRLRRGRFLAHTDSETAPIVAVINETMAERYWPNADVIGKRFHIGTANQPWITVVGVVERVRHNALTENARAEMYVPHAQWGAAGANTRRAMTYVLRTDGNPMAVLPHLRNAVRSIDPNLPLAEVRTLDDVARDAVAQARFTAQLLGAFALLALALAAIGIYGVVALLVTRRHAEIGIRLALGARPASIVTMVVGRGARLTVLGVGTGLVAATLLVRVVSGLLYGVTMYDVTIFVAAPALLATVALLASLVPALRAARVDPIIAIREE